MSVPPTQAVSPAPQSPGPEPAAAGPTAARHCPTTLELLAQRRSTPAIKLCEPGPTPEHIDQLLQIASRVPDHGKRSPWRFVLFQGQARAQAGDVLATAWQTQSGSPDANDAKRLDLERSRFTRAPVVIMVVSAARENDPKIPEWEQVLSAGAVCQTLLIAAHAMGFAGQWLTEWYAYDADVKTAFGLKPGERVAGYVYLGSTDAAAVERPRPDVTALTQVWSQPDDSGPPSTG